MINQLIETIKLTGEDAINFANSLFNPSIEAIISQNKIIDKLNEEIVITKNEEGFQAEIEGLDLSFLEESSVSCMETTLAIDVNFRDLLVPLIVIDEKAKVPFVFSEPKSKYNELEGGMYLSCAA